MSVKHGDFGGRFGVKVKRILIEQLKKQKSIFTIDVLYGSLGNNPLSIKLYFSSI